MTGDLTLKISLRDYEAARTLQLLQEEIGLSKLGLLAQALLAHVILRVGGVVYDVRHIGHPDIVARHSGALLRVEAEVATQKQMPRQLETEDINGLWPTNDSDRGYFCVLDCGPPLAWLCVDVTVLGYRLSSPLRLSLLHAYAERDMSATWTSEFSELILKEARNLRYLTFARLREEVLNGLHR